MSDPGLKERLLRMSFIDMGRVHVAGHSGKEIHVGFRNGLGKLDNSGQVSASWSLWVSNCMSFNTDNIYWHDGRAWWSSLHRH